MKERFIKKYWPEEDVLFYIHFQDNDAVRQIEIMSARKVLLTADNPVADESMLYDKTLDELELEPNDFITEAEFTIAWNDK